MADEEQAAADAQGGDAGTLGGGADVAGLLKEIRDLQKQNVELQIEHRQWLLLRVLLPMFAMIVILVLLAVINTR